MVRNRPVSSVFERLIDPVEVFFCSLNSWHGICFYYDDINPRNVIMETNELSPEKKAEYENFE